jgi:hypothetical protein
MRKHTQAFTTVNAAVDAEMVALINALSQWPRLQTTKSCQGDENETAWVCFRYGEYWNECVYYSGARAWTVLTDFVFGFLAPKLDEKLGNKVSVLIRHSKGKLQGELIIRPCCSIEDVTKAINEIWKEDNDFETTNKCV